MGSHSLSAPLPLHSLKRREADMTHGGCWFFVLRFLSFYRHAALEMGTNTSPLGYERLQTPYAAELRLNWLR